MEYTLVYPMAAMVLLTALVMIRLFICRVSSVKRGEVDAKFYKTYQGDVGESRKAAQHSRHFINLFESPVLFYAGCLAALATGQGTGAIVWLAWAYVACRAIHAFIHLGSNKIPPRIAIYAISWVILLAIWGMLVVGVASVS